MEFAKEDDTLGILSVAEDCDVAELMTDSELAAIDGSLLFVQDKVEPDRRKNRSRRVFNKPAPVRNSSCSHPSVSDGAMEEYRKAGRVPGRSFGALHFGIAATFGGGGRGGDFTSSGALLRDGCKADGMMS